MNPAETALERIRTLVGPRGWLDDPAAMAPYLTETRGLFHGRARAVVSPASTAEVAEVVRLCNDNRIGIVPQGGNTGRCGGAMPDTTGQQIILCLTRLNRIRALDPLNYTLTVEAGCILAAVQAAAAQVDRLFPLSLGAEGSCQIGGNLATNAGGTNVLRYGNARELTLGLEVVLPNGEIWDGLTGLRKNNTGYDLRDLFIGAEGTLGIITAAVLKLFPLPHDVQTAFVALRDLDACIELLARARTASSDAVSTFELLPRIGLQFALDHIPGCRDPFASPYDWYVLLVLSGISPQGGMRAHLETLLSEAWQEGLLQDAVIAVSEAQSLELWKLREGLVEGQRFEGGSIKHDISIPVSRVPEFIRTASERVQRELPGIRVCAFGHVGDGNIHYNLTQPVGMNPETFLALWQPFNHLVHAIAMAMHGSFSAEHGIGQLKVEAMARYKSATELELMRRIKAVLDPNGIMNPGKVLPERR
jgi:FAD/FMN-containing dehydrogenase